MCRPVLIAVLAMVAVPAGAAAGTPFTGSFKSVSCASAGNCTAIGVGTATDSYGNVTATGMAAVTQTNATWGSVVAPPQPRDASSASSAGIDEVACPAAGNCDASGTYITQTGTYNALFASQRGGSWSQSTGEAPPSSSTANFTRIACGGVGDCAAIVDYSNNQGTVVTQGLLATETHGTWGPLVAPSLPSGVSIPYLQDISCSAPGECVAVGEDTGPGGQGLLFTESRGNWNAGIIAPLPSGATGSVFITSVSCPATGSCTAVGVVGQQGLLLDESGGSWRATAAVPPTGAYSSGYGPMAVSCAAPGDCTAVGLYARDSGGDMGPFLLTETSGTWAQGVTANATYTPNIFFSHPQFVGVSCGAPGSCGAAFGLTDNFTTDGTILLDQTAGTWGSPVPPTTPTGGSWPIINAISCPAAAACAAAGSFTDSTGQGEGLVLSQSGGTWGQGTGLTVSGGSGGGGGGTGGGGGGTGGGGTGGGGTGGGGTGGGGTGGGGHPAPRVISLSIKPARFVLTGRIFHGRCLATNRVNRHNGTCTRKLALRIAVKLSVAARVTITIKRELPGRRAGGRCVKASSKNAHARKCTRLVAVRGKLSRAGKHGANAFVFDGKIGGHTLGAGTYVLTIAPLGGGSPRSVRFQLVLGS